MVLFRNSDVAHLLRPFDMMFTRFVYYDLYVCDGALEWTLKDGYILFPASWLLVCALRPYWDIQVIDMHPTLVTPINATLSEHSLRKCKYPGMCITSFRATCVTLLFNRTFSDT